MVQPGLATQTWAGRPQESVDETRPGHGRAALAEVPRQIFSSPRGARGAQPPGPDTRGYGCSRSRGTGIQGSRVTGAGDGARRLCRSGRGGSGGFIPLSGLADCQPLPSGWWGRAGTEAGAATPVVPPRVPRARASWEPGLSVLEWRVRRVAARDEGETHARPALSGANISRASSPLRAPELRPPPSGPGPGCNPLRGRPLTPRQGPNNIRAREVGGARGRLRRGPRDAVGATQTDGCQDLPTGSRILSRATAAASSAGGDQHEPPSLLLPGGACSEHTRTPRPPPRTVPPTAQHRSAHRLTWFLPSFGSRLLEGEGCTWTQARTSTSETRNSAAGTGLSILSPLLLSLCLDRVNPEQMSIYTGTQIHLYY